MPSHSVFIATFIVTSVEVISCIIEKKLASQRQTIVEQYTLHKLLEKTLCEGTPNELSSLTVKNINLHRHVKIVNPGMCTLVMVTLVNYFSVPIFFFFLSSHR